MREVIELRAVVGSLLYSSIGLIMFGVGFWIFDKVTPYFLWKEIVEEKNTAVAILVGAVSLGLCLIIASAIH